MPTTFARSTRSLAILLLLGGGALPALAQQPDTVPALARQVEIIRTAFGVPHIRARNLRAAGYGLAWVQIEDYGPRVAMGLLRGRGEMGRWFGRDSIEGDFAAVRAYRIAHERYPELDQDTRDVYEGFAAGANRYIALHPAEFPAGFRPEFTGYDIAARDVNQVTPAQVRRFLAKVDPASTRGRRGQAAAAEPSEGDAGTSTTVDPLEEGSNAWAFAPSRTKSGHAILLRNPHLNWNSGYYEAQVTVPGVVDFYGDFRIGGPFGVIGGFNRDLGWSTTNNAPDLEEIYSLELDRAHADHYLLDGTSHALERDVVRVAYRSDSGLATETRELWRTPLGPVIHRDSSRVYVVRAAAEGDYRGGEQFLRMMRARTLAEWKDVMRMRARVTSSFTYADRAGNIFYLWNGTAPAFPHPSGGDTAAVAVQRTSEVWSHYVPFDSLPQLLNPKGGYIQNENSSPWFTNLHEIIDWRRYPSYIAEPSFSLRSQMATTLIDTKQKLSLDDVVRLKHSYRMLLADRVKPDLVAAVRASSPSPTVAAAIAMLATWDNSAAPASTGAVLFESWWRRYTEGTGADTMFAQPWVATAPASTPRGLRNPARAALAFAAAVDETVKQYGRYDIPWGDVHRVRMGTVDVPVGGCAGALGCFRVLNFRTDPDGKRAAYGGDGWVLAVEFGEQPRAYSILAYGESPSEDSPHHADQAAMFARGEMKRVVFLERDVDRATVTRYRPGMTK
jgi:acyl-homoserine-lactone acylase